MKGKVRWAHSVLAGCALFFYLGQVSLAQKLDEPVSLRKEMEVLKAQQAEMQKELKELKALLMQQRGSDSKLPVNLVLNMDHEPFKGQPEAPLIVVEFTDYQCQFCRRHSQQVLPRIEREYINPGKVKYVVRDFPLQAIHKSAFQAATAANCAGEQGKYWEMHDTLFKNGTSNPSNWEHQAHALGLNAIQFSECLNDEKQAQGIVKDLSEGRAAGVRGTPTFFLGKAVPKSNRVKVLKVLRGAQSFPRFKEAIDTLLAMEDDTSG